MAICPYCKSEMRAEIIPVRLSRKRKMVYDAIIESGPEGVAREEINRRFFTGLSPGTIRTCIYQINRDIKPSQIKSRGRVLFIDIIHPQDG
jgi:hypothetical protein